MYAWYILYNNVYNIPIPMYVDVEDISVVFTFWNGETMLARYAINAKRNRIKRIAIVLQLAFIAE